MLNTKQESKIEIKNQMQKIPTKKRQKYKNTKNTLRVNLCINKAYQMLCSNNVYVCVCVSVCVCVFELQAK